MAAASDTVPLSRPLSLPANGETRTFDVEATTTERSALEAAFELLALDLLTASGRIGPADGMWRVEGRLCAELAQPCVVTFGPVRSRLDVAFERFLTLAAPPSEGGELLVDPDERDIDYLDEPRFDIGVIVAEELALALDPYPRHADAALAGDAGADEAEVGPFAILARRPPAS